MPFNRVATSAAALAVACVFGDGTFAQTPGPQTSRLPRISAAEPSLTFAFEGVHVGAAEYDDGPTGATVLYFPGRVVTAVDVRGGSPGTTGTDAVRLSYDNKSVDAIVLAGGSAYGLEAADGVRSELMATGKRDSSRFNIASVLAAIIYDYPYRTTSTYADRELGRAAYRAARPGWFPLGARGAGRSASVGKYFGYSYGEPAGQGAAFQQIGATKILVVSVVNAVGNVIDRQGRIVRGNRDPETGLRSRVEDDLRSGAGARKRDRDSKRTATPPRIGEESSNTTLTVVVTNQRMPYSDLQRLAVQVHTSMVRGIQPFQTARDGDVLFAVTTAEVENAALNAADLATTASELAWDAVLSSVRQ